MLVLRGAPALSEFNQTKLIAEYWIQLLLLQTQLILLLELNYVYTPML